MGNAKDLLDRALRDLSPEQRARVLDLTLRLDIDRDDPLWLICLAIGQLQVLVEDAPRDWRETFAAFSTELEAWTDSNLKMLEAIARQAEAGEGIAQVSKELVTSLTALTRLLSEQSQTPQKFGQELDSLKNRFEDLRNALDYRLTSLMESLETRKSGASMSNTLRPQNGIGRWSANPLLLVFLVVVGGGFFMLWQGQQQNAKTLQWLLYKANRMECQQSIVEKSDPQCKPFRKEKGE